MPDDAAAYAEPGQEHAPRKGRPRDASADERILAAAAELILRRGYDNMTVDEVAAAAKAGKATVYRRWSGKEDLAYAALSRLYRNEFPVPDTGSIEGDLRAGFTQTIAFAQSPQGEAYLRMSIAESLRDPRIAALYAAAQKAQEDASRAIFECAIARGEIRADFPVDLAMGWFAGYLALCMVVGRDLPTLDQVDDCVRLLLHGLAAPRP